MANRPPLLGCLIVCLLLVSGMGVAPAAAASTAANPEYWNWATTPPMGWNSYDAYGDNVSEQEILAQAQYMKARLLSHGWNYVIVDYRWYDPGAHDNNAYGRGGAPLTMDKYGRLLPALNRFPSAADGNGFRTLADKIHGMGLKFGIHIMRGIPRLALKNNLPIEGSSASPWDVIGSPYLCTWCQDMFGVNEGSVGGQAYYDSIMRLYARWEVDFIKIDDLSRPYSGGEISAYRKAIDRCGRAIVFSTSPGETPIKMADHIMYHANTWRLSDDFWDQWSSLDHAFDLAHAWSGFAGPGHWPDLDMIPIAQLSVKHRSVGPERSTRFTHDEQTTLLSLWAIASSPLMLGGNLTAADDWTLALITNDEVIAVSQDLLGKSGMRISKVGESEVWAKELKDGSIAIGLFNRGSSKAQVTVKWADIRHHGKQSVRDLWTHSNLGEFEDQFTATVPSHGGRLLKATTP